MKTEKILFALFIVALILRVFNLPYAEVTILSLGPLLLVYFPFGFYFFSDGNLKTQKLSFSILVGMCLAESVLGIIYRFLHLPGAEVFYMGVLTLPFLTILAFILRVKSEENLRTYYNNMCLRLSVFTVLSIMFFFVLI